MNTRLLLINREISRNGITIIIIIIRKITQFMKQLFLNATSKVLYKPSSSTLSLQIFFDRLFFRHSPFSRHAPSKKKLLAKKLPAIYVPHFRRLSGERQQAVQIKRCKRIDLYRVRLKRSVRHARIVSLH